MMVQTTTMHTPHATMWMRVLRSLSTATLVGADIVEVAPAYDHAEITGIAAAHAAFELLSAMAAAR